MDGSSVLVMCRFHHPLSSLTTEGIAAAIPGSDVASQDTLYGAPVEVAEYPGAHEEGRWCCVVTRSSSQRNLKLLCFGDVEMEVFILPPRYQGSGLLSVRRTSWGLLVRKFRIQSHRAVLSPRSMSFMTSLE